MKQALRVWYNHIDDYFLENRFVKIPMNILSMQISKIIRYFYCVFVTDDLIFTRSNPNMFEDLK